MSDLSETAPFWMVYGIGRGAPRAQHDSEAKAIREAERLARVEPGATFVVLESIHAVRKVDVERFDLRTAPSQGRARAPDTDDIPF